MVYMQKVYSICTLYMKYDTQVIALGARYVTVFVLRTMEVWINVNKVDIFCLRIKNVTIQIIMIVFMAMSLLNWVAHKKSNTSLHILYQICKVMIFLSNKQYLIYLQLIYSKTCGSNLHLNFSVVLNKPSHVLKIYFRNTNNVVV